MVCNLDIYALQIPYLILDTSINLKLGMYLFKLRLFKFGHGHFLFVLCGFIRCVYLNIYELLFNLEPDYVC